MNMESHTNNVALIALSLDPKFNWAETRALIEEFGSPSDVLKAKFANQLFDFAFDENMSQARKFIKECLTAGIQVDSLWSEQYPRQLRTVFDAPPILFSQGSFDKHDDEAVAIVGTRNPDRAGSEFAHQLATQLSLQNIPVVSGLARGIDGIALRAALEVHGRVIGVIGTGLDVVYPPEHMELQHEIRSHLLISQFRPGTGVAKRNFPMRNVVMSGFASLTVIVQAGETSGTRIQARAAVKHGRPLVITKSVYEATQWAKDLVASNYDVTVVDTPGKALEVISNIHELRRGAREGRVTGAQLVG